MEGKGKGKRYQQKKSMDFARFTSIKVHRKCLSPELGREGPDIDPDYIVINR